MIDRILDRVDYAKIASFCADNGVKLLVFDFNGVLDDRYVLKYNFVRNILTLCGREMLVADLMVYIDVQYMSDRQSTIEQSIKAYLDIKKIEMTQEMDEAMRLGFGNVSITPPARELLERLSIPYVIYTSQLTSDIKPILDGLNTTIYGRDITGSEKPSVANLRMILEGHKLQSNDACMVGDGLIDDLYPAKLLGMHTILVSPFVDMIV